MPDREKVIKGLECLAKQHGSVGVCEPENCPYGDLHTCANEIARDAIALLKAQEPGVDGKSQEVISGFTIYCPNCGFANTCWGTISSRENTVFDCGKCGQAVKLNDRAREVGKRY